MNKANARLYIPAVEALADGELQASYNGKWHDWNHTECDFDRHPDLYRRKPKPREFWVVTVTSTLTGVTRHYSHEDRDEARAFSSYIGGEVCHVREVEK